MVLGAITEEYLESVGFTREVSAHVNGCTVQYRRFGITLVKSTLFHPGSWLPEFCCKSLPRITTISELQNLCSVLGCRLRGESCGRELSVPAWHDRLTLGRGVALEPCGLIRPLEGARV